MAAPTKLPIWADAPTSPIPDGTALPIVEPSDAVKHQGWVIEKPPFNVFNYWMNLVYQWIAYFAAQIVADGVIASLVTIVTNHNLGLIAHAIPIRGIIWWAKDMPGEEFALLPSGFLECDGSIISDVNSPLNGETLPNINGSGYIIKGGSTSGTTGAIQSGTGVSTITMVAIMRIK